MAVGSIPKFYLTEEQLKDFNLEQYIHSKYAEAEKYGGFIIVPPDGCLPKYDAESLAMALSEVQWKNQKRTKVMENIYKYQATKSAKTTVQKMLEMWETDPKKDHFKGETPQHLLEEFVKLLEDKTFKGAKYSDNNVGTLFHSKSSILMSFCNKYRIFCNKYRITRNLVTSIAFFVISIALREIL